jgi:single-strand DNA-binding protein
MNQIQIVGNVVANAELRTTKTGKQVGEVRVAVNERYFDKEKKEWKDGKTEFFNVIGWDNKGKSIAGLEKGNRVLAIGKLSSREYKKKDGSSGFAVEITAEQVFKVDRPAKEQAAETTDFTNDNIPF